MSAERDAGFAALQNGNAMEAIPYLERAVNSAPDDFQGLLQLGAAYGQVGRHADAVRSVMQAVTLQPSNATARYGLAVAYVNAGHREYALTAAQQALQLQPDNAQARELVARLSGAPAGTLMGAAPIGPTAAPTSYAQPTQALPEPSAERTAYPQPASPASYGQTQMPGAQNQPSYGRPGPTVPPITGGYAPGQPPSPYGAPGAAPPPQTGAGNYQGQGAAAYGGAPLGTYYTPPSRSGFVPPDKFDMKQAVADWVRVIRAPDAFFRELAERNGYNGALAFLVTFGIGVGICALITGLIQLVLHPASFGMILFQIFIGVTGGITGALMGAFLWGGFLHIVGRMFGNRQPYEKTFRVAAYSRAPLLMFTLLSAFIMPFILPAPSFTPPGSNTTSPFGQLTPVQFTAPSTSSGSTLPRSGSGRATNPFTDPTFQKVMQASEVSMGISILGFIWVWCLQAIGLQYAQNLSIGSAAGTVFVALAIPVLVIGIGFALLALIIAALVGASRGASGFQNMVSLLPSGLAVWRGV